jgi:ribulose-5-phosphate 4-epimerase/fuculose-1-phosphate aldolase
MSVTTLSVHPEMSEAEWQTRCDLAALYRILDHLRMTDLIYTHMTARIPGEEDTFLINNYGELFDEVTASSLVKMDMQGNVIGDQDSYNEAGFTIHSGVYKARPDVNCVMHTHTRSGTAISITKHGLLPISQDSTVVMDDLGYHDYGTPATQSECDALGQSCQDVNCVILRNHGLLTLGATVPAAFLRMYFLEHACSAQVAASSLSDELVLIAPEVLHDVKARYGAFRESADFGQLEWRTMLRLLERNSVEYRC